MPTKQATYHEAVGRRKSAIARVRLHEGAKKMSYTVNDAPLDEFFATDELRDIVRDAHTIAGITTAFDVTVRVQGGGTHAQAEAIRLGIARALEGYDAELRTPLKKAGFLKRDPRSVERKKFGLKKARKSPQWSKR